MICYCLNLLELSDLYCTSDCLIYLFILIDLIYNKITVNFLYSYTFGIIKTCLKKCDYNENVTIKGFIFI